MFFGLLVDRFLLEVKSHWLSKEPILKGGKSSVGKETHFKNCVYVPVSQSNWKSGTIWFKIFVRPFDATENHSIDYLKIK